jgi:hypothetical protein
MAAALQFDRSSSPLLVLSAVVYGRGMPKDRNITGAAGVYFAAAELSQLGWIAALTRRYAPRTDVLAQRADSSRTVGIQVKTRLSGWFQLGRSIPLPSSEGANEWFVLISLHGPGARPDFYIVPRKPRRSTGLLRQ